MKKGQITAFVILGLVIVAAIGFFAAYKGSLLKSQVSDIQGIQALQPELKEAGSLLESCIESVAKESLVELGMRGGYIDNSGNEVFEYSGMAVTYLYSEEQSRLPTIDEMSQGISEYIKQTAKECITAQMEGIEITPAAIKDVIVDIKKDNVAVGVKWPISLKKGDIESKIDGFKIEVPVRLGTLHSEITGFMIAQSENPDVVSLSYLIESGQKNGFSTELNNFITTYVFVIQDKEFGIDGQPYKFIFANGY